jgi:hypothetical protein
MLECTLRSLDANLLKTLGLLHWPHNGFHELLNLLVEPSNICVLLRRLLVHFHSLDS